jgi:hypothetical protein
VNNALPHSVPAKGHEVVHAVVRLCYACKDARHALALLAFCYGLKPEMGWPGRVGDGIVGGGIRCIRCRSGREGC